MSSEPLYESPVQILEPPHLVRLTGFRAQNAPVTSEAAEAFSAAWRAQAETVPAGVLYRELCRQVPEWSRKAAAEMDAPILFDFLEYTVLTPETALAALPQLPAEIASGYEMSEALYHVDFRLVSDAAGSPECLMFNLFELSGPPGLQQGFLMSWPPRGEFKTHEPGFFSSLLHEALLPNAQFAVFNRAEWRDADAYAAGIGRFTAAFPREERKSPGGGEAAGKPPVISHLGLFQVVASVRGEAAPRQAPATAPVMVAVRVHEFGGPDVLKVEKVPRPKPGPGEIAVRVQAAAINPLDVKMRSGEVGDIYPPWFPDTLGYSVSGIIEAVGPGVTTRRVGEEVYGINNPIMRHGYAECVVGPESFYYPKPTALDWAAAAAAPSVFATAYGALFGRAELKPGQRLLIHGASGVIGSCAVQLAKQAGAYVIATASGANRDAVKALGADEVIDYRTERFEDSAKDLDMVLDTQGGETRERSWGLLKRGGTLVTLVPPQPDDAKAAALGVQAFMSHGHPSIGEIMPDMSQRLESGLLKSPEVAAVYPLSQAAEAHAFYESKPPRGRIVLSVPG